MKELSLPINIVLVFLGNFHEISGLRLPSRGVARPNVCPEICRIKEDNKRCREIPHLKQNLSIYEICDIYLLEKFNSLEQCQIRCKGCSTRIMTSRCSVRNIDKLYAVCKLNRDTGPCNGYFTLWYYNYELGDCKKMVYGGCGGNKNKFDSDLQCFLRCGLLGILAPHPNSTKLLLSKQHQEL